MSNQPARHPRAARRPSPLPLPVRLVLRGMEPVAPDAAARFAARLFLTPRPAAVREAEQAVLAEATRGYVPAAGSAVATYEFGDAGPLALLVHGWNGHAGQMTSLVAPLRGLGYRVVLFDAPAHGASSGTDSSVAAFAEAIAQVARHEGRPALLLGHSVGALACARAVARGLEVGRLALVAPAVGMTPWVDAFAASAGLSPAARDRFATAVEARAGVGLAELDLARIGPALSCPIFIAHDLHDTMIARDDVLRAAASLPGARVLATSGHGHVRILAARQMIDALAGFAFEELRRFAPRPPSRRALREPHLAAHAELVAAQFG
jgi:pimeloyl-ACP methyl ester carboxylesterase